MNQITLIFIIISVFSILLLTWLAKKYINLQQSLLILESDWDNRELEFEEEKRLAIEAAKKRSRTSQRNQIKGQLGERFTPFMGGFPYKPSDCRFLGEPIDFVIFNNLHACSDGLVGIDKVEIIIADVKTGKARLSKRQKILKQAVDNGQVRFETMRIDEAVENTQVDIE